MTSRTQRFLIEGCTSSIKKVLSGVPQGTVLGFLMFLLYVDIWILTSLPLSVFMLMTVCCTE